MNTRIENKNLLVEYTPNVPELLREAVHKFLEPFIIPKSEKLLKSTLKIQFTTYSETKLRGVLVRNDPEKLNPVLSFEVQLQFEVK